MPERELPPHPSLEQYKKQAKDLVKDRADAAPDALVRIQRHHPRLGNLPELDVQRTSFKLCDAQLVIAREHAFESWSKFARHIQALRLVQPNQFAGYVEVDGIELAAEIAIPKNAAGLVLFANASGSGRHNPRNRYAAEVLNRATLGTVLADLLTEDEELADIDTEELQLDIRLLSRRVAAITDWIGRQPLLKGLALGYLGSGTGAAAALLAVAEHPSLVQAVVSSRGRPDLAGPWLWKVQAPTLFIVGSKETAALAFNHSALAWFPRQTIRKIEIIDGAHRVEEKSSSLARDWFCQHLMRGPQHER